MDYYTLNSIGFLHVPATDPGVPTAASASGPENYLLLCQQIIEKVRQGITLTEYFRTEWKKKSDQGRVWNCAVAYSGIKK